MHICKSRELTENEALCSFESTDARVRKITRSLQLAGQTDTEIGELLFQFQNQSVWIDSQFSCGWRSLTHDERCLYSKSISRACRELHHAIRVLGHNCDLPVTHGKHSSAIKDFIKRISPFFFNITEHEPMDPPIEYSPLLLLAEEAERWPEEFKSLTTRDDNYRQRRELICRIASFLRQRRIRQWAAITSDVVALLTGDEPLADNQIRDLVNSYGRPKRKKSDPT